MRRAAIACLFGGFVMHLTLGGIYTFGNLTTYVTSFLHERVDSTVAYTGTMWAAALMNVGQGLAMPLGGVVHERFGARIACFLGCSVLTASMALSSLAVQSGLTAICLVYGLTGGIGVGLAYVVPLSCAMKWFPDNRGLANGVIVAGFGLGSLIFNWIQTGYLNPDNLHVGSDNYFHQSVVLDHVPGMFLLLALVYALFQVSSIVFIRDPSHENLLNLTDSYLDAGEFADNTEGLVQQGEHKDIVNKTPRQALNTCKFYQLCIIFFANNMVIGFINPLWKAYGQTFIRDDHFLAFVGSMAAVFNCLGRVLWGFLYDRTSFKTAMLVANGVLCIVFATLSMTPSGGRWMFACWIWLITGSFSATFCLPVSATAAEFGVKHAGAIYGLIFSQAVVYSPVSVWTTSFLLDKWSFVGAFYMQTVFALIGILTVLCFQESGRSIRRSIIP